MNTSNNSYVLGFAITVCVGVSAMLALAANSLRSTQEAAAEFDRQKNVMMAAGLLTAGDPRPRTELEQLYQQRIREVVVDTKTGQVLGDKTPKDVVAMNKAAVDDEKKLAAAEKREADKVAATRFRSVAIGKGEDGKSSLILPISGKGLWSTIYGYLALAEDGNTVRGVTFYKHGETPGLGGEVENPAWCAQWQGKSVLGDGGKLVGIEVKKGKVDLSIPADKAHKVDGLSGATITSNGVTKFVKADLEAFGPYLASVRK